MTRSFGFGFFCALIDNVHLVDKVHLVDNVHPVNIVQLVDRVQLEAGFRPRDILVGEPAQLVRLPPIPAGPVASFNTRKFAEFTGRNAIRRIGLQRLLWP